MLKRSDLLDGNLGPACFVDSAHDHTVRSYRPNSRTNQISAHVCMSEEKWQDGPSPMTSRTWYFEPTLKRTLRGAEADDEGACFDSLVGAGAAG